MNACYFLAEDLRQLREKIAELVERFREIGQDMGQSCAEGAETYHDNFGYEDGERQQRMLSARLREMTQISNLARVVSPEPRGERVGLGRTVTVEDLDTGERKRFKVGSYIVFSGHGTLSYRAPLVRLLIGAGEGDVRTGAVGGQRRRLQVVEIE